MRGSNDWHTKMMKIEYMIVLRNLIETLIHRFYGVSNKKDISVGEN